MAKCKNCGMELGPEDTCVFATYRLDMNGKELMICCERCAANMKAPDQPAAPPVRLAPPALSVKRPPVNAPARKKRSPRKAPKKAVKKTASKRTRKAAKNAARRPKPGPSGRRRKK